MQAVLLDERAKSHAKRFFRRRSFDAVDFCALSKFAFVCLLIISSVFDEPIQEMTHGWENCRKLYVKRRDDELDEVDLR